MDGILKNGALHCRFLLMFALFGAPLKLGQGLLKVGQGLVLKELYYHLFKSVSYAPRSGEFCNRVFSCSATRKGKGDSAPAQPLQMQFK